MNDKVIGSRKIHNSSLWETIIISSFVLNNYNWILLKCFCVDGISVRQNIKILTCHEWDSPQSDCCSWAGRCNRATHWTQDLWPLGCTVRPPCSRCEESHPVMLTRWCHCSETKQSLWQDLRDLSGSPLHWEVMGTMSWWTRCHPVSSRQEGACHRWQTATAELIEKAEEESGKQMFKLSLHKWIIFVWKTFNYLLNLHVGQICGACQQKHNFHSVWCLLPWHDWPPPLKWAPNCPEACIQK